MNARELEARVEAELTEETKKGLDGLLRVYGVYRTELYRALLHSTKTVERLIEVLNEDKYIVYHGPHTMKVYVLPSKDEVSGENH